MGSREGGTNHPNIQKRGRLLRGLGRRWPRTRLCLRKGCAQHFRPDRAFQRYCSQAGRNAARAWPLWKAQEKYRATSAGKEKRNAQSRRYRERVRKRNEQVHETARVISTNIFSDASCDRPGCYEKFVRSRRSPLQHFCSKDCRRALQRVREREKQWREARIGYRRAGNTSS